MVAPESVAPTPGRHPARDHFVFVKVDNLTQREAERLNIAVQQVKHKIAPKGIGTNVWGLVSRFFELVQRAAGAVVRGVTGSVRQLRAGRGRGKR